MTITVFGDEAGGMFRIDSHKKKTEYCWKPRHLLTSTFLDNQSIVLQGTSAYCCFFWHHVHPHAHSYLVVLVSTEGDHRSARTIDKRGHIPNAAQPKINNTDTPDS